MERMKWVDGEGEGERENIMGRGDEERGRKKGKREKAKMAGEKERWEKTMKGGGRGGEKGEGGWIGG